MFRESVNQHPAADVAVSHALLDSVSAGRLGPIFRLYPAMPVLAFGMADRIQQGYPDAVRIAEAHGFSPIERLAGGRAAVFHESTLAFTWARPEDDSRIGITARFREISGLLNEAFGDLGISTQIGEVEGEYCPGEYSINIGGRVKVMGVGQRLVRGAAHVGGVIVVDGATRIRNVLIPVYRALKIDWDPRTVGALADRSPGISTDDVASAVIRRLEDRYEVKESRLDNSILADSDDLLASHLPKI